MHEHPGADQTTRMELPDMSNDTLQNTLTAYAQVPVWILRSGSKLSNASKALYGVIMSYANNSTRVAFPGRERLAEDLGVSVATVKRSIKELEDYGALRVTSQRNTKNGSFRSNSYTLVFDSPWATSDPPPWVTSDPLTTPMLTTPSLCTSEVPSDTQKNVARLKRISGTPKNPGGLTSTQRKPLLRKLEHISQLRADGHKFHDDTVQAEWETFCYLMEDAFPDSYHITYADTLENYKWTIRAEAMTPRQAGAELNTIISTCEKG